MSRPYRVRRNDPDAARELGRACGLGPAVAQVLLNRGLDTEEAARAFLNPTLAGLTRPDAMVGRRETAARLARAIRDGERIAVFGDYDVDGTTSCAILADVIEELGGDVHAFVAHRFEGGYGFSDAALERCLAVEPNLIVTCDCGSSDHPRVARAMQRGVDVVVIDHHLVPAEPLPALAFLNPHRPECGFPYKDLCSAGLALSVAAALRAELDANIDIRRWLDLVALGTVADVVRLEGDNRRLVRAGLKLLSSRSARPGVVALRELARLKAGVAIGGTEISFRLAPRLNAAGRLGDSSITLALLRAKTLDEARRLAMQIESINDERKAIERRVTEAAMLEVERLYGADPGRGVVVAAEGWHRGVVGITAARLVDRFRVPAVVIALDEGVGHGSGRSVDGFDLHAAFEASESRLIKFGGHVAAAGLSIEAGQIDAFRGDFAARPLPDERERELPLVDVELGADFPMPTVEDLMALEPVGEGNPTPLFGVEALVEKKRTVGNGEHLKLELRVGRRRLSAFGGKLGARVGEVGEKIRAVGELRPDTWRGGGALELSLRDFR